MEKKQKKLRDLFARTWFREVEAVKCLWFARREEVGSLDQVDLAYFRGLASPVSIDRTVVVGFLAAAIGTPAS
jgi:hypothetical protein